jgi:elongation factor P--beta-lysine ligase
MEEEKGYIAMIDLFYGDVFGIVPKYIINDTRKFFKDNTGDDFDLHCVKEEGWNNLNEVHEFASMIKQMSTKSRVQFMTTCPSKHLKLFVKKHDKYIH